MANAIFLLSEPEIEFRYGQRTYDPRAGLGLFGPYDADAPSHPGSVAYGLIGAPEGIAAFEAFGKVIGDPVVSHVYGDPSRKRKEHLLWPPFPGFEAAFGATWNAAPVWSRAIDREKVLAATRWNDPHKRAYEVSNIYLKAIRLAAERDETLGVIVCVVPDEVWMSCRPQSRIAAGQGDRPTARQRVVRRRQPNLYGGYEPEQYEMSVDFRRQLKARAMEFKAPLQLVRESTLALSPEVEGNRRLTVLSDRAWNLSSAIYYKVGGKPWRLSSARGGVCYVGIAFKRSELTGGARTACCAAQMFLDTGDGVVFRGEFGPWYSPNSHEFHLNKQSARELLRGVLDTYSQQGGRDLKEIFLHSRSTINQSEFEGYSQACPNGVKLVGVRVRQDRDGIRLYRPGKWPVLRGALWPFSDRTAYLWASGFKPTVLSYDGWEVPVPLRIDIQHGEADIKQVAQDILGLTKLNYNACKLGDASPVTIGFSDAVGEILISNPTVKNPRPNFKFYI